MVWHMNRRIGGYPRFLFSFTLCIHLLVIRLTILRPEFAIYSRTIHNIFSQLRVLVRGYPFHLLSRLCRPPSPRPSKPPSRPRPDRHRKTHRRIVAQCPPPNTTISIASAGTIGAILLYQRAGAGVSNSVATKGGLEISRHTLSPVRLRTQVGRQGFLLCPQT